MQLHTLLMLLAIFSAVTGLKCRVCGGDYYCWTVDCLPKADRCATLMREGAIGCIPSSECKEPPKCCENDTCNSALIECRKYVKCCKGHLCNGAVPPGSSILLLLLSASIMTIFL